MRKRKKGYVLPIAIIAAFLLTAAAITALTVIYRYSNATRSREAALRERVFDDPSGGSSSDGSSSDVSDGRDTDGGEDGSQGADGESGVESADGVSGGN